MKKIAPITLLTVLGAALALGACAKKQEKPSNDKPAAADIKSMAAEARPIAQHFAGGMMASYEQCRALLAGDSAEGVSDCAKGIVETSKSALAGAPEAAHEHIATLVAAAEALSAMPADDIQALRMGFGQVSKSVIAMLGAAPEIAKGYHVFECPMTKTYPRWAQPDAELANPYMGSSMLTCGLEIGE